MKKTSCYQCPTAYVGCHANCPHYTQPADKYRPRDPAESDYIDYVKQRNRRLKGVSYGATAS